MTKRGLRLFYSEDEGDSSDDGNKMALATVILFYISISFIFLKLALILQMIYFMVRLPKSEIRERYQIEITKNYV